MDNLARKALRNADRVIALEKAMFEWRSRHLILVLTLSYRPEWQHEIALDTIRQHRDRLLNNMRCNELLRGINAYVWKIEEGTCGGGLHLHALFFYDGSHRADIYIAKSIGDYWVDVITHGKGAYWNSNALKDFHANYGHGIGTGQINRCDLGKREALQKNLLYLAKDDQRVTVRTNPHQRTFGTSQFPT